MNETEIILDKNILNRLFAKQKHSKIYKRIFRVFDIVGLTFMFIALFKHNWPVAFLLYVIFFPDLIEMIRFFKKLFHKNKPA